MFSTGSLSARQGCVVEAAASANSHRTVWVLIAGANSTSLDVYTNTVARWDTSHVAQTFHCIQHNCRQHQ